MSEERLGSVGRQLYAALVAMLSELGEPDDWDADVEIMFSRQILEQARLAVAAARDMDFQSIENEAGLSDVG